MCKIGVNPGVEGGRSFRKWVSEIGKNPGVEGVCLGEESQEAGE